MNISGQNFYIEHSFTWSVADSFSLNKLKNTTGNGNVEIWLSKNIFDEFFGKNSKTLCCFLKNDMERYLFDAESEISNPSQEYRKNISLFSLI